MVDILKLNKLMLVSIILLTILSIGAVSAAEADSILTDDNSADILSANTKAIYVDPTGSDSGSGSSASPYATINKALSEVNASDDVTIHLAAGTYTGENNTALNINFAHANYNGTLTIVGAANGGTILDGENEVAIIKSIGADSFVTLKDITFTHGRTDMGSAIRSSGDLTIDSCVFEENYVTNLGAIYSDNGDLTIKNSKFIKNSGNQYVDLYFSHAGLVTLINNVFESGTATSSWADTPAVFVGTGKSVIKGNTFKNLTSSRSAGALAVRYNNGDNIANITDNTFIDCTYTGSNGGIVFFQNSYLKNNKFINCTSTTATLYSVTDFNANVAFEDVEIDGTQFVLKANVTDDMGNTVQNAKVIFNIDGKSVGSATSNANGVASLTVNKLLENGEYAISGTQSYSDVNPFDVTVVDGKATVNFDHSPAEVWVSTEGNDTTGDGSEANPFLTLKKALDYGTIASVDLTVHIKNGLYQGSENRDLSYSNVGKITIIGESYGNVIIDAEHAKSGTGWWASGSNIFTFGQNLEIALVNLTLINCDGRPVDAYALTMNDNIVINSSSIRAQSPNEGVFIDNLRVINGTGQAINAYNLVLTNSLFENCNGGSSTGLLWLAANNGNVIHLENNTFIGNTIDGYSGGAAYYAQGDLVSINNTFDSNTVTGSASNIAYASGNNITSINDKFINNEVTSYVAQYRSSGSQPAEIIVENITFINNKASANGAGLVTNGAKIKGGKFINNTAAGNGGAIYLLNHGSTSQVTEMSIEDVTFEDNTAASGNDIFIAPGSGSNVFANLNDLTITANSQNVTELSDIITVTVSHPSGAIIGGGQVTFYFNGSVVGKADLINQNATLEYVGFKNDTVYDFTSVYEYATENDTYVGGIVSTNIADAVDSIEFYVSNSTGDDVNGNGSENNPFKSISRALSEGYTKSTNITVHVLEGNYTGDLNTELRIPTTVDVTIVGEDADKVIITDSEADYFITALAGNSKLTLTNVTINRAARDTQSAIYIEEGANVEIDNVKFIGGQGNYGGAINTAGTLVVNNSYFFDNGYGDVSKRANAYYGGAIYNDGILIIDNSTFEANHAGRLSTIANQGTLYMSNSKVTDSLNAYAMNMDLVAIGAFGGQKGNITIENSIFTVTNRTVDELSNRIYMPQNSLTCLAIGSSQHVTIINTTFENEGGRYTPNAFGGLNSWNLVGGGYTMVTGDVEVYNSTFRNLQSVSLFYTRTDGSSYHSHRVFDGCLFENVEYLIAVVNSGENLTVAIHNSVILSDNITKIGVAAGKTIDMDISDNWWGSNNATYKNATITTPGFLSNYVLRINEVSSEIVNPENYLVLTLNATNKTGLVQDITLAFKVSDGENVTDYNGTLRPRDYVMSATNGTLAAENGTIDNAVVTAFEGTENQGYYVEATVDGQTVNLTVEEPLTLGNATILAEDIELAYNQTQINVTVLEGTQPATGNITLRVNNKTYTVDIIDGVATFNIDVLARGNYTLEYSIDNDKVYNPVSNSSTLTVNGIPANMSVSANESVMVLDNVTVEVVLPADATGNVSIGDDSIELVNGTATFVISGLGEGNYTITVDYAGDDKYDNDTKSVNVVVSKYDLELNITVDEIVIGSLNINMTLPEDATGNVTFTVNGTSQTVEIVDGKTAVTFENLTPGKYDIDVVYSGDNKYNANNGTTDVTVTNIVNNETYSKFFDENGTLSDEFVGDELVFDGEISNKDNNVININRPVTVSGNNATLNNIALNITSDNVTVNGLTMNVDELPFAINVDNADNVVIANNTIDYNDNGTTDAYAIFANGADNLTVSGNNISYEGNTTGSTVNNAVYIGNSDNVSFEDNDLDITIPSSYVPWAEVPAGSGNWVSSPVSEGIVFDNCSDLSVKDNGIEIDYNNVIGSYDTIYAVNVKNSDNAVIDNNTIDATGASYIYGLQISGDNFTISNNTIDSTSDSYYACGINVEGPATGNVENNDIEATAPVVSYAIYSAMSNGNVAVNYTNNTIVAEADTVYAMQLGGAEENVIGNDITAIGNHTMGIGSSAKELTVKDNTISANGDNEGNATIWNSIAPDTVGITVASGNYDIENNTIETTGDYTVKAQKAGEGIVANNNLTALELTGDASVLANENGTVFNNTPSMTRAILIVDDVVMYYKNGTRLVAYLVDQFGNPIANQTVVISINGRDYVRTTAADGNASIALGLNVGVYNATVTFNATEPYSSDEKLSTVTILSTINGTDVTKVFRNGTQYYATFVDGQGNPLANGTMVRFNINGVMYDRKVNENGTARLNINLDQGTYILTAIHPDNGEMASNNITVLPKITENSDLVKYYRNDSQYVVRIIGDDGNPVGAGETVTFNINGVMYERKTNESGYAKLNINLQPGDYIITAMYGGCNVANNITVKPILNATDITMTYKDGTQFKASLVDGQGNPLANTNITFNINGVFYNRTTDAQGIAKLNINLMAGEYIITSMYNDAAISNRITIRA
ncbi:MAG: hypothetical protein E7Z74_07245 [Methanobrevibacter millerae]|uniref:Adhesin-like protein n=1 Tax=Methanobrevibacter millerae TaxID=230361 RepID=A0A8T3VNY9_9EURY|nr:hypothetical protein [Methanobrevibacter millerae]